MAPKKTIAKHSRLNRKHPSKEKWSKHAKDSSIRREEGMEEPSSTVQKAFLMAMRPVVTERRIIFKFLDEIGLQLGDKIEEQGWIYFCSLNTHT